MIETLSNIMKTIYDYYVSYGGNSKLLLVYFVCLIYLCFTGKEVRVKVVYPSVLLLLVLFNPWLFVHVFDRMLGGSFWRAFWMLPIATVIGIAVVKLILLKRYFVYRISLTIFLLILITHCGANIYTERSQFEKADNMYKLPKLTLEVVDAVLELDDKPKCIFPAGMYCYTRQYKSEVKQLYGRDRDNFIAPIWRYGNNVISYLTYNQNSGVDLEKNIEYIQYEKCNFIIENTENISYIDFLDEKEYSRNKIIDNISIFYNPNIKGEPADWIVNQRGFNGMGNRMGYVLESRTSKLIIIDGGFETFDGWMYSSDIQKKGKHINAWIITAFDLGHIGVFKDCYMDKSIEIDKIFIPQLDSSTLNEEEKENYQNILAMIKDDPRVVYCQKNEDYSVCELQVHIVSMIGGRMVFALNGVNNSMLFCSDASRKAYDDIFTYIENNDVDYMEIAVHENLDVPFQEIVNYPLEGLFLDCVRVNLEKMDTEYQDAVEQMRENEEVYDFLTLPNLVYFD